MRIAISARPRVVLPGAQALLSFGAMLSEPFAPLARSVKACTDFRLLPNTPDLAPFSTACLKTAAACAPTSNWVMNWVMPMAPRVLQWMNAAKVKGLKTSGGRNVDWRMGRDSNPR